MAGGLNPVQGLLHDMIALKAWQNDPEWFSPEIAEEAATHSKKNLITYIPKLHGPNTQGFI
jgi:hypothetical protein